jgi:hypothetical protein
MQPSFLSFFQAAANIRRHRVAAVILVIVAV